MRRLPWILAVVLTLVGPVYSQEPRHVPLSRAEELTLPPRQEIPPPPQPTAGVPTRPITVQEAVDIALLHQPAIGAAQGNLRAAAGRTLQAVSALNPNLSLSASETPITTLLGNGAGLSGAQAASSSFESSSSFISTGLQATASVRQLLYDFEKTRESVAQVRAQQRVTRENLVQTDNDVVLQVQQAFYACLQADRLIKVNETDVQNQREHLQQAQALHRSGVGKAADVVRAENAVATALINLKQSQGDADVARINLARSMGIDPRTPLQLQPGNLSAPDDQALPDLIDQALQARPEVRAANATVDADLHGIHAAERTNAPSISATASLTSLANPIQSSQQLELATAGVAVSWTFGDGGLTQGHVEEAAGNLDTARSQLQAARSLVIADVTQSYVNLKTAEEKLRLFKLAVASGEENLHLARGRYAAGLGLAIDVLDAESALLSSLTGQVNQESAVDLARAALCHALGLTARGKS